MNLRQIDGLKRRRIHFHNPIGLFGNKNALYFKEAASFGVV